MKKISKILCLLLIAIMWSCSNDSLEKEETATKRMGGGDITLEQFKQETGLNDFKTSVKIPLKNNTAARNADGSYNMEDFVIDSELIRRTVVNERTTYTFAITPKIITSKNFYNLIMRFEDGDWQSSIVEMVPSEANLIKLEAGSTKKFSGKIKLVYDSNAARRSCTMISIESHHCTMTGECASGTCDLCNLCVDYSHVTLCGNDEAEVEDEIVAIAPQTGTGGGGGSGGTLPDPSGYAFSINLGGDFMDINGVTRPKLVKGNLLATSLWAALEGGSAQSWAIQNPNAYHDIVAFYIAHGTAKNKEFVIELIDAAIDDTTTDRNAISFVLAAEAANKLDQGLDAEFLLSVDDYVDLDMTNEEYADPIIISFITRYYVLKSLHPTWGKAKLSYEASKGVIHITLDALGLVPGLGEPADLLNGVLYTVEGDGINATLSYASAVPIVGWASAGVKFGIKVKNFTHVVNAASTITNKARLIWKVEGTVITFGDRNILRQVMQGVATAGHQIHHIIPWAKSWHPVIQKAAKSGNAFHMSEAINGISLSTAVHYGSHPNYDANIVRNLNEFLAAHPAATPDECYTFVTQLLQQIRTLIANNPNVPLNQLVF